MAVPCPTPQRTPTLNRLVDLGVPLRVVYLSASDKGRGWGDQVLRHSHGFLDKGGTGYWRAFVREALAGRVIALVVFGYRHPFQVMAMTLARALGIPVAVRSDANAAALETRTHPRYLTRRLAYRTLVPRGAEAWTVGTLNAEYWRKVGGIKRQRLIPYEVPTLPGGGSRTHASTKSPGKLRLLYVGRLSAEKRVEDLVNAFALGGTRSAVRWSLTIVGDGPEGGRLAALAQGLPEVRFVGSVPYDELAPFYEAADVLVLPSSYEPWGLVVNEALGFGVRVVSADAVGSARDLLNQENGETYGAGHVWELVEALLRCEGADAPPPRPPLTDTAALMAAALGFPVPTAQ